MESLTASNPSRPAASPQASPSSIERWAQATRQKQLRGEFIVRLLASKLGDLTGKRVLDIGCGEGGTSLAFATAGAAVVAIDLSPKRLTSFSEAADEAQVSLLNASAEALPFASQRFDAVIVQDVLEHCADKAALLCEAARVLTPQGIIYLSTPNRSSLINFFSDPHWALPLVSALRRRWVNFFVVYFFRRESFARTDAAELETLEALHRLFRQAGLCGSLQQRVVFGELFRNPRSLVWASSHLAALATLSRTGADQWLMRCITDRASFSNRFLMPSFYFLLGKRDTG